MKYIITLFVLAMSLWGGALGWQHDYNKALKEAQESDKQVYMLITSESCKWCRKFEDTTLADEAIIQKLKAKYVLLHINRGKDFLPKKFQSKRVPRHYFITPEGEVIYTFLGYWDSLDFGSFIDDVDVEYKRKFQGDIQ